jgi:hypothetical protein
MAGLLCNFYGTTTVLRGERSEPGHVRKIGHAGV